MSPGRADDPIDAGDVPGRDGAPTYRGSRFPWWLTILWVLFLLWGVGYLLRYGVPDLKGWLMR